MPVPLKPPTFVYHLGPLTIELWKISSDGRTRYAYRLFDAAWGEVPVFEGDDFKMPNWTTYEETSLDILSYLVLQADEVDKFFFKDYTPEQIRWRDTRGSVLRPEIVSQVRAVAAAAPRRRAMAGGRRKRS